MCVSVCIRFCVAVSFLILSCEKNRVELLLYSAVLIIFRICWTVFQSGFNYFTSSHSGWGFQVPHILANTCLSVLQLSWWVWRSICVFICISWYHCPLFPFGHTSQLAGSLVSWLGSQLSNQAVKVLGVLTPGPLANSLIFHIFRSLISKPQR